MLKSQHLLILARLILLFGAASLVSGGIRLFRGAIDLGMPGWYLAWIIPVAALIGGVKARFVMRKRMRMNIERLKAATGKLWVWQIYPPQMLGFILVMVLLMNILKRVMVGSAGGMGALGGVDIGVAVALLVASLEYRRGANSA